MSVGLNHPDRQIRAMFQRGEKLMAEIFERLVKSHSVDVNRFDERFPPRIEAVGGVTMCIKYRPQTRTGSRDPGQPSGWLNGKGDIMVSPRRYRARTRRFPEGRVGVDVAKVLAYVATLLDSHEAGRKAAQEAERRDREARDDVAIAFLNLQIGISNGSADPDAFREVRVDANGINLNLSGLTRDQLEAVLEAAIRSGVRLRSRPPF